jgi:SAM-dependent methyltransferase
VGDVYDWTVEHPRAGGVLWRVFGSDLGALYAAAARSGGSPPGAGSSTSRAGRGGAARPAAGQGVAYVAADISQPMLDRTMAAARERAASPTRSTPRIADVETLPFPDGSFDLVVSFTGLHCFPDPARAVAEMDPGAQAGRVITGSAVAQRHGPAIRTDPSPRPAREDPGPGCTRRPGHQLAAHPRMDEVTLETSGAIGYFRA